MGENFQMTQQNNLIEDLLVDSNNRVEFISSHNYRAQGGIVYKYKIHPANTTRHNITKCLNFILDRITENLDNPRVKLTPICPIILMTHACFPLTTKDEVINLLYEKLEKILQSATELNLEEIIFEFLIIPNPTGSGRLNYSSNKSNNLILQNFASKSVNIINNQDSICLARAIITALTYDNYTNKNYLNFDNNDNRRKYIRRGDKLQEEYAIRLHKMSKVEIKRNGNTIDDVKLFEDFLNVRIIIYSHNNNDSIIYEGNINYEKQTFLYYNNNHFNVISKISSFLQSLKYCHKCLIGYQNQHTCKDKTLNSRRKIITCEQCNKEYSAQYKCCC